MSPLWSLRFMFMLCSVAPWVSSSVDFISPKMREYVENLKTHYRTSDKALFGSYLFPRDLENFEEGEQKVLLRESLDVYVTILSDMRNQTQDMEITKSIMAVRAQMEDLRESYFHSREHALKRHLQNLWALKTDDVTTQRKAVYELLPVFQEASRLGSRIHDSKQKQRRRRQTPKGRVPQP